MSPTTTVAKRAHLSFTYRPGFSRALALFREAARRVPAYQDFLKKHGIRPDRVSSHEDFSRIPPTDKKNYIGQYGLADLCWDGSLEGARFISASSGSTGVPYYWPREVRHDIVTGRIFRRIYGDIFGVSAGRTLFLDMFALGTWLAGFQFYDGAVRVAESGNAITIAAPGIEKDAAVDAVKRLAGRFDRIVLAGYPPFIKDVLEHGAKSGIRWKTMDVRLLSAGEGFSELWRDRVLRLLGGKRLPHDFISVYGMAEAGVVAHETPLSVSLRRSADAVPELRAALVRDGNVSCLYQYDPAIRYFEPGESDSLLLTADGGIPLVRYNTRDQGGLLPHSAAALSPSARKADVAAWPLPFVYLFGRRDLSISFYALNIYVENIKRALESSPFASSFSSLFTMNVGHTKDLDQRFEITIELSPGAAPSSVPLAPLTRHVIGVLKQVNAEYAKLHSAIGQRAAPKITLVRHGMIETRPGRKHAWVRKQR